MIAFIRTLQLASGAVWLAVLLLLMPGFVRIWRRNASKLDAQRQVVFWFAALQVGFVAQWLGWPGAISARSDAALIAWATLYLLSCLLGVSVVARHFQSQRERR